MMQNEAIATKNTKRRKKEAPKRGGIESGLNAVCLLVSCCVFCGYSSVVRAGEITTNGTGGGAWSEPATWRGGAVPKPDDEVTIRKGDAVVFDRNDDGKITCAKLFID